MDKDYVSIRRLGRFHTQLEGLFVQKVSGKGLSTEDYTTEEKTKLAGIASGAEVNVIEGVQVNGADLTPDANRKVNVVVPENVAHKVSGATSGNFAALNAQGDLTDSGKDASDFGSAADVEAINEKIPTQASASNQLADKNFVNSSIQTETATFRGNYACWCELPISGNNLPDNNDYAVLIRSNDRIQPFIEDPDMSVVAEDLFYINGIVYKATEDIIGPFDSNKAVKVGELGKYYGDIDSIFEYPVKYAAYGIASSQWAGRRTYFRIVDWDEVTEEGVSPDDANWVAANWQYVVDFRFIPDEEFATFRWKYSGKWETNGIEGWSIEYKINDTPLTAAQLAALNSDITKSLTTKLQNLPSKPVDTASQSLTDGEKTQARTNIGAASSSDVTSLSGRVANVEEKIPTQASAQNQLADKNFVNSSIQTETAHFRGNYDSVADLPLTGAEYGGTPTNNDYMVIQDTTGKLTHEPSPWYDETGAYVAGEIRIVDDGVGSAKFYLCLADNDYDDPKPPATSPTYWEWLEDWGTVDGGTWRFKYSGVWSVNGVKGWRPEYQVNEEPLTAAQIAALNSNITEALTNKLVALPAKPVDTAAQTLSDAEKAQARTNIGATAPEVFWAVYGSTTHAEVAAAVSAGKVVMMRYNNKDYHLVISNTANHFYFSCLYPDLLYRISLTTGDAWGAEIIMRAQQVANLVTSWQSTPDNSHYPAEKLVKDSLDAKQPLIDSSHKLDYSLLDNTPTIPAAQVQSDWNQSDNTQVDFIKNKPTIPSAPVTMQGATASAAGSAGYAPAPAAGDEGKFLRGDGTWQTPSASIPQEIMNLIYAGL